LKFIDYDCDYDKEVKKIKRVRIVQECQQAVTCEDWKNGVTRTRNVVTGTAHSAQLGMSLGLRSYKEMSTS